MRLRYPIASGFYTRELDMSKIIIKDEFSETPLDMYIHGLKHELKSLETRICDLERLTKDLVVAINMEQFR